MIVVYKRINTFQLTEDQFGIIDNKGNWVVRLHKNDALNAGTAGVRSDGSGTYVTGEFVYHGEGFLYNPVHKTLYNVYTGKTVPAVLYSSSDARYLRWETLEQSWVRAKNFENGLGVFYNMVSDGGVVRPKSGLTSTESVYEGSVYSTDIHDSPDKTPLTA